MNNDNYFDQQPDNEVIMKKRNPVFLILGIIGIVILSVIITIVAIKLNGSNKSGYEEKLDLGRKYLLEMNYEQAILAFEEAIKINPKETKAYILLSRLYDELDEPEKAEEVLKRAETAIDDPEGLEIIEKQKKVHKDGTDDSPDEITDNPKPSPEGKPEEDPSPTSDPDTISDEDEIPTVTPEPVVSADEEKAIYELIDKMVDYEIATTLYSDENISDTFIKFDRTSMARATALSLDAFDGPVISGDEEEDPWMEFGIDEEAFKKAGMELFGVELSTSDLPRVCSSGIIDAYINEDGIPVIGVCVWETEGAYEVRNTSIAGNGTGYTVDKNLYTGYWGGDDGQVVNTRISYLIERSDTSSYGFIITGVKNTSYSDDSNKKQKNEAEMKPLSADPGTTVSGKYNFADIKNGDTIIFGSYEQDNDLSNGKEPIEWLVLSKSKDSIMVISKYALDNKPYNDTYADVSWENCTLRKWLNNTFYSEAFGKEEKELILSATDGNIVDKVFLLSQTYMNSSENELKNWFIDKYQECACIPTAYAWANGIIGDNVFEKKCNWWLRSKGNVDCMATYVSYKESLNGYDEKFYNTHTSVTIGSGIRPVLYISLKTSDSTKYSGPQGTFGHVSDINNCVTGINYYDADGNLRFYSVNTYYDTGYLCSTTMYSVDNYYKRFGYDLLDYTIVYLYDKNNNLVKTVLSSYADYDSEEWQTNVEEAYIVYWDKWGSEASSNSRSIYPKVEKPEDVIYFIDSSKTKKIYGTPDIIPARNTDNWAKAYLDGYKEKCTYMENPDVRLVFVNDDTIPEMYVAGDYWDYYLFTQKNGVYDVVNSGYSSIKWIRKENILSMFQTKFNYEEYKIENGKFVLLQGESDNWENAESINKTVYSWEQCELMLKNIIDRS